MAIPLDPGRGGQSIGLSVLKNADIIVSTTNAAISRAIRMATGSAVSHAILYIGGGQVMEAIGEGVTLRPLSQAIAQARLAVTYRHPSITDAQALIVRDLERLTT
jgi:cell wall-associated NlpC family hydrolase